MPAIVFILLILLPTSSSASPERDVYALGKLKASLVPSSNATALEDWDPAAPSPTHCSFSGVTCDTGARVVSINITALLLHGGTLPPELALFDALANLTIAACGLLGHVPASLHALPFLRHLNLTGALPSGPGPRYFPSLELLDVYNNNLSGPLPPFGPEHAVTLRYLHLGGNYFSGAIPDEYGDMAELEYLHLGTNCLSGRVPASLGRLKRLREMYIGYDNQFDGPIPPEFRELEALVLLDMSSCSLTGPIPLELGQLKQLNTLYVFLNWLSGDIPPALQLWENNLSGHLPAGLGKNGRLKTLNVGYNNLSGRLPAGLGNYSLKTLDVSYNHLTGLVPPDICTSGKLEKLVLMENVFFGPIPKSLGDCKTLRHVHLNNNFFSGPIP